ncbi:MAG: hypothetical protein AAFO69_11330 [Bacteroidota bacterium]
MGSTLVWEEVGENTNLGRIKIDQERRWGKHQLREKRYFKASRQ